MNDAPQIPHDMMLPVTLRAMQWEMTLQVLRKGPYDVVAPIIEDIQRQCMRGAMPREPMAECLPNQRVNPSGMDQFKTAEARDG
jgi:hypothetical protein